MEKTQLKVLVKRDAIALRDGQRPGLTISFQRTLRIPDDGKDYPLPPSLGAFPLRRVSDYADTVPADWLEGEGVFLPMYQREAMWISFGGESWYPHALKVAAGRVNALSGESWDEALSGEVPQDYMVCPDQPWLDGFNTGDGTIRQFVAMPLGSGYTVEGQVTGEERHGGLQLCVYPPVADRFSKPSWAQTFSSSSYPFPFLKTENAAKIQTMTLERMLADGTLTVEVLEKARESCKDGEILDLLRETAEPSALDDAVARSNAEIIGLEFRDLRTETIDPELARYIPECLCRRYRMLAVEHLEDNRLMLAMLDPRDLLALDDVTLVTGFQIVPVQASLSALEQAIDNAFGVTSLEEVEETMKDISAMDFGSLDFAPVQEMGLAAGGRMKQSIAPDRHGMESWDIERGTSIHVHLVDIFTWARITGLEPPETPVTAAVYSSHGYPWFDLYDETGGDLTPSKILAQVDSMAKMDAKQGLVDGNDASVPIPQGQVVSYVKSSQPLAKG